MRSKHIRSDPRFADLLDDMANTLAKELKLPRKQIGTAYVTGKLYEKIQEKKVKRIRL